MMALEAEASYPCICFELVVESNQAERRANRKSEDNLVVCGLRNYGIEENESNCRRAANRGCHNEYQLEEYVKKMSWNKTSFTASGEFLFECLPLNCSKGKAER